MLAITSRRGRFSSQDTYLTQWEEQLIKPFGIFPVSVQAAVYLGQIHPQPPVALQPDCAPLLTSTPAATASEAASQPHSPNCTLTSFCFSFLLHYAFIDIVCFYLLLVGKILFAF